MTVRETPKKKITVFGLALWKIIVCLTVILGGISAYLSIKTESSSSYEKFDSQNPKGEIQSPSVSEYTLLKTIPLLDYSDTNHLYPKVKGIHIRNLSKMPVLTIQLGGHLFLVPTIDLYQGIEIMVPFFSLCTNSSLQLVAKDDRLYVSAKFIDFKTENEIGKIEFNRWKLYNDLFLDYTPGDDKFEVIDRQGNIIFSIVFVEDQNSFTSFVNIAGYFVSPSSILILNNREVFSEGNKYVDDHKFECIKKADSNWKQNAQLEISKIKSTFKTEFK